MNRLDEIKKRQAAARHTLYDWARFSAHATYDIDYLLAEVERQAEEIRSLRTTLLWIAKDNSPHDAQASAPEKEWQAFGTLRELERAFGWWTLVMTPEDVCNHAADELDLEDDLTDGQVQRVLSMFAKSTDAVMEAAWDAMEFCIREVLKQDNIPARNVDPEDPDDYLINSQGAAS